MTKLLKLNEFMFLKDFHGGKVGQLLCEKTIQYPSIKKIYIEAKKLKRKKITKL